MDGDETGRKKFNPDSQPMRCTRATDCPVAARHGNAALWPCPWPRLCTSNQSLFQSTVPNYLFRNPQIFLQTFLITRSQASTRAISDYKFAIHTAIRRGACFYLSSVYIKKKTKKRKKSISISCTNNEDRRRVIPVVFISFR